MTKRFESQDTWPDGLSEQDLALITAVKATEVDLEKEKNNKLQQKNIPEDPAPETKKLLQ